MKLLVITQRVDINDDNLGFFHRWLEKFAEKLDEVFVICLWQGGHNLPQNVHVFSMGKERGFAKMRQFIALQKHLLEILPKVDGVFFHMAPVYAIASFPLTAIFRKKKILWFVHGSVNWKLKLAERLVDKILTASEESCRLKNRKKIRVIGHGIDIDKFKSQNLSLRDISRRETKLRILSAGRISPVKDQETLIKAIDILVNQKNYKDIEVKIIGSPLEKNEKEYLEKLKESVSQKKLENYIEFLGGIPYAKMPEFYGKADIFINLSHTGSIDKAVLEAMAVAVPVLTSNEAFLKILPPKYLFRERDSRDLAEKIISLKGEGRDVNLREIILKYYNLDNLIDKILNEFKI